MVRRRAARLWHRHRRWIIAGAAALLVVVLVLVLTRDEEEAPAPERPEVESLVVRPVEFEEWIETTGTVEALSDALLTAEAAGTVVNIAEPGDVVAAGQVVARLDAGQQAAAVAQAAAAVADARAAADQAEQAYQRQLPLVADTIISPLEFEQVGAQRRQARAALVQALAAQREAEELLEQTLLHAPFAGTVEQRWVRAGEQVAMGQEVIRIVGPGQRRVTAGIPERFAGDVREGATAMVRLHAYGLGDFASSLSFVGNAVDPQSRTFPVRVDFADPGGVVKADMIARVRVVRRVVPHALVLPRNAVQQDEGERSVLVLQPLDSLALVHRQPVAIGPTGEQGVVVETGLEPGAEVVVLGQDQVVAGDTVRVVRRYPHLDAYRAAFAPEPAGP
jgi:membrane fusion protein, multidrug efflux system